MARALDNLQVDIPPDRDDLLRRGGSCPQHSLKMTAAARTLIVPSLLDNLWLIACRRARDGILYRLQQTHLDDLSSRLGLYHHWLLGEGVDALVRFRSRFFHGNKFNKARQDKRPAVFEFRMTNVHKRVQYLPDIIPLQAAGVFCDSLNEL
jgi:hypothetical protein